MAGFSSAQSTDGFIPSRIQANAQSAPPLLAGPISILDDQQLPSVDQDFSWTGLPVVPTPTQVVDQPTIRPPLLQIDPTVSETTSQVPALKMPWWIQSPVLPIDRLQAEPYELDQLIWMAIANSPHVQSILIQPQIQEARANETLGVFDPTPFINSVFNDSSNPVGNTLTTGGPPRLNENLWENSAGVRAKTKSGAQTELLQEMNFRDNNSVFFIPHNQADTRMVLRYTQPLMRGAGATYNRSSYVIAQVATAESIYDATQKIQEHAFSIANNYWELYYARAIFQQYSRGIERLQKLRDQLAGRADLDSLQSQLLRAEAQIDRQRAQQARAVAQITASEAKLRAAVGGPELTAQQSGSLIPATPPADWKSNVDLAAEMQAALSCHPRILAKQTQIKSAKTKLHVAENELRPTLNLVMEGYARGLNGDYNLGSSIGDQFSQGAPSYFAGLNYQRPWANTTAKAIEREKRLEMRRALLELDRELLEVGADVTGSLASVVAAYAELESAVRATIATISELEYLEARWSNPYLESSQTGTSQLLDQLLSANVQLIQSENVWARAQADHMLSLARLRLASGSLLPASIAEPR